MIRRACVDELPRRGVVAMELHKTKNDDNVPLSCSFVSPAGLSPPSKSCRAAARRRRSTSPVLLTRSRLSLRRSTNCRRYLCRCLLNPAGQAAEERLKSRRPATTKWERQQWKVVAVFLRGAQWCPLEEDPNTSWRLWCWRARKQAWSAPREIALPHLDRAEELGMSYRKGDCTLEIIEQGRYL